MAAKTKTYRKECKHCGTEYLAKSALSKTCSDSCRKALSRARKPSVTSTVTSVTVTPEKTASSGSQVYFRNPMELAKILEGDSEEVKQFYQMVVKQQQQQIELLQDMVKLLQKQIEQPRETVTVSKSLSVPVMPNKPLVLPDETSAPQHAAQTFEAPNFDDLGLDLKSLVKDAGTTKRKSDQPTSSQRFMDMINAINNETGGWAVKKG